MMTLFAILMAACAVTLVACFLAMCVWAAIVISPIFWAILPIVLVIILFKLLFTKW